MSVSACSLLFTAAAVFKGLFTGKEEPYLIYSRAKGLLLVFLQSYDLVVISLNLIVTEKEKNNAVKVFIHTPLSFIA